MLGTREELGNFLEPSLASISLRKFRKKLSPGLFSSEIFASKLKGKLLQHFS